MAYIGLPQIQFLYIYLTERGCADESLIEFITFSGTLISGIAHFASVEPVWPHNSKTSPLPSPHLDKRFFDSSLIEMRSQASSTSTIDYDSNDDVWIRRADVVLAVDSVRRKKVSWSFFSHQTFGYRSWDVFVVYFHGTLKILGTTPWHKDHTLMYDRLQVFTSVLP